MQNGIVLSIGLENIYKIILTFNSEINRKALRRGKYGLKCAQSYLIKNINKNILRGVCLRQRLIAAKKLVIFHANTSLEF